MKRIRFELRTTWNEGFMGVGGELKRSGPVVLIVWVIFLVFGFDWIDGWLLLCVGAAMFLAAANMLVMTKHWRRRAVSLLWTFLALTMICIPAGIAQIAGGDQAPFVTRTLWRAMALVGAGPLLLELIRPSEDDDGQPWDGITERRKRERRKNRTVQT